MKTDKNLVKTSDGWPVSLFPETRKAISGPEPGSPEAKSLESRDAAVRNQAILTALRMAGIGLLAGGGTRLLQEGFERFLKKPGKGYTEEVSIDIHRPGSKSKRRGREKRSYMEDVTDWPLYYPLLLGSTGLGLYGGYKGVQGISDWLKKRELESELQAAREEYEEALDERYAAARQKQSSLNTAIDSSYERWLNGEETTKEAGVLGTLGGLGIGTAALIWLLSHKAAYDRLRKSDPEAFRKKVLEQRRRVRQAVSPPPIVFEMEPEEEEEKKSPEALPKAAAEALTGGYGDDQDEEDIAKLHEVNEEQIDRQMEEGTDVESEHTDNPAEAEEIAKDHVVEDPKYYTHLEEMEEEAEAENALAGPEEDALGDPSTSDVDSILKIIAESPNLDDSAVHQDFMNLGVEPHEGEEVVYSVLQDLLRAHGDEVDPAQVQEREIEDEEEEAQEEDLEKASAAADHSCGRCVYFNGGVCEKQDKVMEEVGEDNLTIYLSKPTQTNSCPVFEQESKFDYPEEEESSGVSDETKEALLKSAFGGLAQAGMSMAGQAVGQGPASLLGAGKDWLTNQALKNPALQRQITQAAQEAANDPQTLQPAAKALVGDQDFQRGMNEAAMEEIQKKPFIGSLFGS